MAPGVKRRRAAPAAAPKATAAGGRRRRPAGAGRDLEEERLEGGAYYSDEDGEDGNGFFRGGEDEGEDEEEEVETAEEKRLRLAKAYLARMQREVDGENGEAEEAQKGVTGGPEEDEAHRARLAARLQQEALEAAGHLQRRLAHRVGAFDEARSRRVRCHRKPLTAVALTEDDATAVTVSKCGGICAWDLETFKKSWFDRPPALEQDAMKGGNAPAWAVGRRELNAVAVSGNYVATGGGDCCVHVWDRRSHQHIKALTGHKQAVTGLAFREGTEELFSASNDRSVRLWNLDDMAYIDTLFGHQNEVSAIDCGRKARPVTVGHDRTVRLWKVQDETHLIFKGHKATGDCCRLVSGAEFVSGGQDGALCLWSHLKKKAIHTVPHAHAVDERIAALGPCAGWVSALGSARGGDVLASGAGDGLVRLWGVVDGLKGHRLDALPTFAARGFVNGLAVASSCRFVLAAVGQEPRLGRWARDRTARNEFVFQEVTLADE